MEKVSRKQRAAARAASHRERFSPWSQSSLLDLLTAAACSPGALHRYSSVGYTIKDVIHLRPTGTTRIPEEKLQELLDDTLTRKPQLRSLEDYIPLNPATCVKVRVRGRRYRLHPAGLERPVIAVARTLRVAYAVDATLLKLEGFGVEDLLELVLRYVDRFIEVCSPFWPEQVAEDLDASPNVRAAEVEAIRDVPSLEAIAEECMYPERALRALKWGTVERRQINFEPDGDTILGMPLAVRLSAGVIWPMPPSFLMESLFASAQNLAQRALRASQECSERFHSVSVRSTTKFFGMRAPDLSEQRINVGSFNALLPIAAKHWLALEMVSSLDATTLDDGVHGAVERLRLVCPGQRYARGTGRTAHIPMDAEVVRLLIVSGAGHLTLNSPPGVACMTLDDLEWISSTAEKPEDIFLFSRDLAAPPGVGRVMSFETINAWEIWRNNGKAFHRAGVPFHMMTMGPHEGDIEWRRAGEREGMEGALFELGLPELRDWDSVTITDRSLRIMKDRPLEGWIVSRCARLSAIKLFGDDAPDESKSFLDSASEALLWTLESIEPELAPTLGLLPTIFSFVYLGSTSGGSHFRFLRTDETGCIVIGWSAEFWTCEVESAGSIERMLRESVFEGLRMVSNAGEDPTVLEKLRVALMAAPRALSIQIQSTPQRRADLPKPQSPSASFISTAQRTLSEHMRAKCIVPGDHKGVDAVALETKVIYPFLKEKLEQRCGRFRTEDIIHVAACELECAAYWRASRRESLKSSARNIVLAYDPIEKAMRLDKEDSSAERRLELLIELVLANPRNGQSSPDGLELQDIVSVSQMCVESGFRGEAAHYGLMSVETHVSDMYEVTTAESGEAPIDWVSFHRESMVVTLDSPGDHESGDSEMHVGGARANPRRPNENENLLANIDKAMQEAYGFGSDCLMSVIRAMTTWTLRGVNPMDRVKLTELVEYVEGLLDFARDEIRLAVEALVLRGDDLRVGDIEPWEFAKRRVRLVTQPLIRMSDTEVLVLPWFLEKSLSIYVRYLSDGRLPWPKAVTHPTVLKALGNYRQARNTDLEHNVADVLDRAGFKTLKRVKKPRVIGLSSLTGEIDCLVADERSLIVWVLEVKDPEEVFSVGDIARSIRRFYDPEGWLDKLAKKIEDIKVDVCSVARAIGAASSAEWSVRGLIVTRRVVPSAYVRAQRFPFATVDRVVEIVSGHARK